MNAKELSDALKMASVLCGMHCGSEHEDTDSCSNWAQHAPRQTKG